MFSILQRQAGWPLSIALTRGLLLQLSPSSNLIVSLGRCLTTLIPYSPFYLSCCSRAEIQGLLWWCFLSPSRVSAKFYLVMQGSFWGTEWWTFFQSHSGVRPNCSAPKQMLEIPSAVRSPPLNTNSLTFELQFCRAPSRLLSSYWITSSQPLVDLACSRNWMVLRRALAE